MIIKENIENVVKPYWEFKEFPGFDENNVPFREEFVKKRDLE